MGVFFDLFKHFIYICGELFCLFDQSIDGAALLIDDNIIDLWGSTIDRCAYRFVGYHRYNVARLHCWSASISSQNLPISLYHKVELLQYSIDAFQTL